MVNRLHFLVLGLVCACIAVGCNGDGTSVKLAKAGGNLTYKGSPLAGAQVTFMPDKGPLAIGMTDLNGDFKLNSGAIAGCAVGPAKVAIKVDGPEEDAASIADLPAPKNAQEADEHSKKVGEATMSSQRATSATKKSLIPKKYKDVATSGLAFTIESDSSKNNFKIDLKD